MGTASVLFEDDFNAGAGNWQQSSGLPVALLGNYVLNLGAEGNTLAGNETWTDYRADFRATLPQGTGIGFLVRVTGPPANPEGYLVEYQLLDNLLGGGTFRLSRLRNGVRTGLAQSTLASSGLSPLGWLLSLPHTFSVTARDDTIEVRVDGVSILSATDPEPIPAGRVGIRPLLGTIVLVDKVTVTGLFEVLSRWRR